MEQTRSVTAGSLEVSIKPLLEASDALVELQHLGRKRICGRQLISTLDPLVPL
jgi:hypothetical protein